MSHQPFVCVVDDDPSILPAVSRLLRAADFEVDTFGCGKTFATSLRTRRPDAVVVDIHMPVMDGFAVRDEIRGYDATLPIVFITAHEGERIDRRVAEDSASTLVRKPFAADRLIEAIVSAIKDRSTNFNQKSQEDS